MIAPETSPASRADTPPHRPRPWLAFVLSWFLPGLGHVYAGRPWRGLLAALALYITLVPILLLTFVAPLPPLRVGLLVLALLLPLLVVPLDAERVARGARRNVAPRRAYQRWYMLVTCWAVGAFVLHPWALAFLKAHVAEAFRIPSGSMVPTILPGDFIIASRRVADPVRRGSIAIYRPNGDAQQFVHRVVGVPGDTLAMRGFELTVNGRVAPWPSVLPSPQDDADVLDPEFSWQRSRLAPGIDSATYAPSYGTWGPLVLGEGEYFLLGDERANSLDSRHRGVMRREALVGHPAWVYFSRDPESGAVRWRRIGSDFR